MSALNGGQGLRGNPPKGPPAHPCSWGWPAGGSSEKCGRGSEVPLRRGRPGLGQMVRIAPLRGLHGSGLGALRPRRVGWGTTGAGGGTGSAPAVSRSFYRRPLEGCGPRRLEPCPWCAVERRALPGFALSSPRSCSPAFRLSLSLPDSVAARVRSFLLSWVSPFVLSSPAGLSPLPPLASPPPSALLTLGFLNC